MIQLLQYKILSPIIGSNNPQQFKLQKTLNSSSKLNPKKIDFLYYKKLIFLFTHLWFQQPKTVEAKKQTINSSLKLNPTKLTSCTTENLIIYLGKFPLPLKTSRSKREPQAMIPIIQSTHCYARERERGKVRNKKTTKSKSCIHTQIYTTR